MEFLEADGLGIVDLADERKARCLSPSGREVKRGELWTVASGVYASKPRPAVIVQYDVFELTESVTVAPLTTTLTDAPSLRLRIPTDGVAG